MSDGKTQVALREWRAYMTRRETLLALAGVSVFVTLAAPFNSGALLGFGPRLVYWAAMVSLTFAAGSLITLTLKPGLGALPFAFRVFTLGILTSLGVLAVVVVINAMAFGWVPPARDWPLFAATLVGMTLLITAAFQYFDTRMRTDQNHPPRAGVPILDRVPIEKRGALVALSVEDHYVRVRTSTGEALILMRLGDAVREVGETTRGAQVHRSHWAAFDQVTGVRRDGDRAILSMTTGDDIPVSRTNIKTLKEAGLLPR
ncbi:LytTR family DNA-binding domain-containing protein [Celeribacter sp.]|uniref:LytTR family DNA-binding domain-containing protein n=1 Tax=Celeribacter sp. TaxID=1890673 RepID=UPI003A94268D